MFLQRPKEIKQKRTECIGPRPEHHHQIPPDTTSITSGTPSPSLLTSKSSRWRATAGRSSCASPAHEADEAHESSSQTTPQHSKVWFGAVTMCHATVRPGSNHTEGKTASWSHTEAPMLTPAHLRVSHTSIDRGSNQTKAQPKCGRFDESAIVRVRPDGFTPVEAPSSCHATHVYASHQANTTQS